MPVAVSPVVREILTANMNLSTDDIMKKARAKGVTAPDKSLKDTIYNVKSELRQKAAKAGAKPAPKAAPVAARVVPKPVVTPASAPSPSSSVPDLSSFLANVALVNAVVGACGGVEQARKAAEAVRACGSVEAFLLHIDLVAQVRGAASA